MSEEGNPPTEFERNAIEVAADAFMTKLIECFPDGPGRFRGFVITTFMTDGVFTAGCGDEAFIRWVDEAQAELKASKN